MTHSQMNHHGDGTERTLADPDAMHETKQMECITKQEPEETVLLIQQLPNVPGKQVTLIHVNYPPGAADAAHRHPAFKIAYVLSGRVVSQVGDDPIRTYDTGEFFTETPNESHKISRNASDSQPASVLAMLISDINAQLVEPLIT